MITMKNLIIALLLASTAACTQETIDLSPKLATKVELSFDTEVVYQEGVKIKITKIEDSRCPKNVTCVWAGMARVFFTITEKSISKDGSIDFESNPVKTTIDVGGQKYNVEVSDVLPYPKDTNETSQKEYKVSLTLSK
jgi:hypothetical protein